MFDKTIKLLNGVEVPMLGLGTWLIEDAQAEDVVDTAISMGYRHIDTAIAYGNERGVGRGIKKSGILREEIFVTTKIPAEHKNYNLTVKDIDESLERLGLDYIDLMLIHCPQPWAEYNRTENRYFKENMEVYQALTEAYEAGKLRAIGVSNFRKEDIDNLCQGGKVKPMVNQVLCHVLNTPKMLIDYCVDKGIVMEAYSPLVHGRTIDNDTIINLARKYQVTVEQLCIRYDLQLGMITLPKTTKPERMQLNADVDFEISKEDMEAIQNINTLLEE